MATFSRYSNIELLNLPDCWGLTESGKCSFLMLNACIGAGCKFCREKGSEKASQKRLCSLDEKTQAHIANKYYGGSRPWLAVLKSSRR